MKRPVFIIGSPRSGTTLLYDMLQSAGGFARYPAESNVFNMLVPTFGRLKSHIDKQRLLQAWLRSALFRATHLEPVHINQELMRCSSGGEFLNVLMEAIAQDQGVERWADQTPSHLLHIPEIRQAFPEALFVHMIRDGRDVALSLGKPGWVRPLPGQRHNLRTAAAMYWAWMVRKGRQYGQTVKPDYLEIRYEDLVQSPHVTLRRLADFIGHELDYDKIQQNPIGSVRKPNTSFTTERAAGAFNPVARWKRALGSDELSVLEFLIGDLLTELDYPLAGSSTKDTVADLHRLRSLYPKYYEFLLWMKKHTPLHKYFASRDLDHRMFHAAAETVDYGGTDRPK